MNFKFGVVLAAVVAFGTQGAQAADMPVKARPMVASDIWTGFYVFGGGGYGVWDAKQDTRSIAGGVASAQRKSGGDGYFGTAGVGYDYRFSPMFVAGIFADGQFGSLSGTMQDVLNGLSGTVKDRTNWAAGARVGYLITPTVLSYFNGGYTHAEFSRSVLTTPAGVAATTTPSFDRDGWFLGGGVEYKLDFLGFGQGWFGKTEYRVAHYSRINLPESLVTGAPTAVAIGYQPLVQTVSTSLIYKFNWGR
jgi:outer membrane immunogenic protein